MALKEKINQDFKDAFKAKEEKKVSVLRMLNSAIKNKELEKRAKLNKAGISAEELEKQVQLTDEETLAVISAEAKRRRDSIDQYKTGGRAELASQEEAELKILAVYLPEQLSEDKIRKMVKEAITSSDAAGTADLGKVMKILAPQTKGKADGNLVNKIVREELGN
ncbi:MAG: GatB/YqeY domain-containing protein [Candidatus Portnoybacteria bacterium]|jgi:hypothetical protein|nr:GatB/YqeY domain-containing protein [Candidatus Portnoybacteria bacterium]